MHLFGKTTKTMLAALSIAASLAAITGCSAQPIEATGSSNSKLLAPKAVYKALASDQTKQTLGISEWRVYRGKTDFILTGYDAAGKAVKGVSVQFGGKTSSSKPTVTARLLDGTRFAAHHEYGGGSQASDLLKTSSKAFVARAINDMTSLKQQLSWGKKTTTTAPAAPAAPAAGAACSADMTATMASALQCLSGAGVTTGTPNQAAVLQCVQAALSAAATGTSCQNTGTTGSTGATSGAKAPASSTDDQKEADKKQDEEQDKGDGQKEADKAQDKAQDDADDQKDANKKQDEEQDAEDAQKDEQAGADAQSASEDKTCSSCAGTGAEDLQTNDSTGEVQTADSGESGGETG